MAWRMLTLDIPGDGELWRGEYKLAHQSQQLTRDVKGEEILSALGKVSCGYVLTDQQIEDCRTGRISGMGYRYVLYVPGSSGTNWTAFWDEGGLDAFLTAYDLTLNGDRSAGESFEVYLPESDENWLTVWRDNANPPRRFESHSNDIGDWCPWSDVTLEPSYKDTRCPAGCTASEIAED